MVNNVVNNAKNIISFAGNVSYRKIDLNGSFIKKRGLWKPTILTSITGSYFTDYDDNTYSQYQLINRNSWVFKGIKFSGNYFGKRSLNNPLNENRCSGHELDKCVVSKKYIIAKGTNIGKWGQRGGGNIIFFTIGNKQIFSTGSIVFTGGIYTDNAIKGIVINVLNKFKK